MFDLDHAIARWRQEMTESGLAQADILDELESHLRDAVETQDRSGFDTQYAFEAAVQSVGHARALKQEFTNSVSAADRLKDALLTLAGIPNHNLVSTMNTSHAEPAWATYLKAITFLIPAVLLAIVSAIFVVPKLQQICRDAGLSAATAGTFWNLTFSSIQMMLTLSHYGLWIAGGLIALLLLLEWRFAQWPRYRRAAVGCGAFVVNSLVLLTLFIMFLAAIVAAPALSGLPK